MVREWTSTCVQLPQKLKIIVILVSKNTKNPQKGEKVWPTTSVKGGQGRRGHQTCQKVEDEKFNFIFKLYFVSFPVDSG